MDAQPAQSSSKPLYILGPCSVENRDQMLNTARGLQRHIPHPFLLRGGLWKPRTRPGLLKDSEKKVLTTSPKPQKKLGLILLPK